MDYLIQLIRLADKNRLSRESYGDSFFSENLAFRLRGGFLEPVKKPSMPDPGLLKGIEFQKRELFRNTEQFVKGYPANDVLLWGARGTGKSSLVKATLKRFHDEGLRIIQVYKFDFLYLTELYELLGEKKQRFILFFDDLSFEPDDESFKLLKSLLEGDIEERPENVLVYATSNRRNIVADIDSEDRFPSDRMQERISLADRFGLKLGFFSFDKETYLEIVFSYLKEFGIYVDEEKVRNQAVKWATERGSFSGRTALQFVRDFVGRLNLSCEGPQR